MFWASFFSCRMKTSSSHLSIWWSWRFGIDTNCARQHLLNNLQQRGKWLQTSLSSAINWHTCCTDLLVPWDVTVKDEIVVIAISPQAII